MRRAVMAIAATAGVTGLASCGGEFQPETRMVLEAESGVEVADLGGALEGAITVIERRLGAFGYGDARVERTEDNKVVIEFAHRISAEEAMDKVGRTALLQFCQPVIDETTGSIAVVRQGAVQYRPQTCEPASDGQGNIVVEGGSVEFLPWPAAPDPTSATGVEYTTEEIVWQPASAEVDGVELTLDGEFLRPTTFVTTEPVLGLPILVFEWRGDGSKVSEEVTSRLAERNHPVAFFLDGEPLRGQDGTILAPLVRGVITSQGTIEGLTMSDAQDLSTLLNTGAFPIPLRVVDVQDVGGGDR